MSVLDRIAAEIAQDLQAAKARQTLVELLRYTAAQLRAQGFAPDFADEDGMMVLRVDPDRIEPAAPPLLDAPAGDAPLPVFQRSAAPATAAPAAAAQAVPAARVTGPFTEDEVFTIRDMDRAGKDVSVIAHALNRDPRGVGFQLRKLREVEAARGRAQSPVIAPEAADAPDPAGPHDDIALPLDDLNRRQRQIEQRLRALGYPAPHAPDSDVRLLSSLTAGAKLPKAADAAGLPRNEASERFRAIVGAGFDYDDQLAALEVVTLRARAAEAGAAPCKP